MNRIGRDHLPRVALVLGAAALLEGAFPAAALGASMRCDFSSAVRRKVGSARYDFWLPSKSRRGSDGASCISSEGDTDRDNPSGQASVSMLQRALRQCEGHDIAVDGVFGPRTREAVKRVQRRYGLEEDGVYGPETARHMRWYGLGVRATVCARLSDRWPAASRAVARHAPRSQPTTPVDHAANVHGTSRPTPYAQALGVRAGGGANAPKLTLIDFGPFRMTPTSATIVETWRESPERGRLDHSVAFDASVEDSAITLTLFDGEEAEPRLRVTVSDGETLWESDRGDAELIVGRRTATLQLREVKLRDEAGTKGLGPVSGQVHGPLSRRCVVLVSRRGSPPVWEEDEDWSSALCRSVRRAAAR